VWETDGIDSDDDGIIDVTLPGSADHKDLHVIVTRMAQPAPPSAISDAIDAVVAAFASAPVPNPDGQPGIRIHIHEDTEVVDFEPAWPDAGLAHRRHWLAAAERVTPRFATASPSSPDAVKRAVERFAWYAIFANRLGRPHVVGHSEAGGNALVIAVGEVCSDVEGGVCEFSDAWLRDRLAGVFMHELGHTLGLGHGGGDQVTTTTSSRTTTAS
jgi:hypothetical protein